MRAPHAQRALALLAVASGLGACQVLFNPDRLAPGDGGADASAGADGGADAGPRLTDAGADGGADAGPGADAGAPGDAGGMDAGPAGDGGCVTSFPGPSGSCTPLCIDQSSFTLPPTGSVTAKGPAFAFVNNHEGVVLVWTNSQAWLVETNGSGAIASGHLLLSAGQSFQSIVLSEAHEFASVGCPAVVYRTVGGQVNYFSATNGCPATTGALTPVINTPLRDLSWQPGGGGTLAVLSSDDTAVSNLTTFSESNLGAAGMNSSLPSAAASSLAPTTDSSMAGWFVATGNTNETPVWCPLNTGGSCMPNAASSLPQPATVVGVDDQTVLAVAPGTNQVFLAAYSDFGTQGTTAMPSVAGVTRTTATLLNVGQVRVVYQTDAGTTGFFDVTVNGTNVVPGPPTVATCAPPGATYAAGLPSNLLVVRDAAGALSILPMVP